MKKLILVLAIAMIVPGFISAREITGTVKNESGNVLSGVLVTVQNTPRSTVTDVRGNYKIEILSGDKVLVFSYIGMESKTINIGKSNIIDITLKTVGVADEEILIRGYEQPQVQVLHIVENDVAVTSKSSIMIRGVGAPAPNRNTENYSTVHENGFKDAKINPLSTFSISPSTSGEQKGY